MRLWLRCGTLESCLGGNQPGEGGEEEEGLELEIHLDYGAKAEIKAEW